MSSPQSVEISTLEDTATQIPVEEQVDAVEPQVNDEAIEQEYKAKAEELENRLDRLEGRQNKEEMLAAWFEAQDSDVTVKPILKKGMQRCKCLNALKGCIQCMSNLLSVNRYGYGIAKTCRQRKVNHGLPPLCMRSLWAS